MNNFLLKYIKNPKDVGSIIPSSKYLVDEIISKIDFENCECIIEYGPGTGVITEKIISRKNEDTLLLLIEKDLEFTNHLKKIYKHKKNVIVINDSAENLHYYKKKYNINKINYIISGLPFASLSSNISHKILETTNLAISSHGEFIIFQYTLFKTELFKKFFDIIGTNHVLLNFPPAYVIKMRPKI